MSSYLLRRCLFQIHLVSLGLRTLWLIHFSFFFFFFGLFSRKWFNFWWKCNFPGWKIIPHILKWIFTGLCVQKEKKKKSILICQIPSVTIHNRPDSLSQHLPVQLNSCIVKPCTVVSRLTGPATLHYCKQTNNHTFFVSPLSVCWCVRGTVDLIFFASVCHASCGCTCEWH